MNKHNKKEEMANKMYQMNGNNDTKYGQKPKMNGNNSGHGKGMNPTMNGGSSTKSSKETMNGPHTSVSKGIYTQNGSGSTKAGGEGYKM